MMLMLMVMMMVMTITMVGMMMMGIVKIINQSINQLIIILAILPGWLITLIDVNDRVSNFKEQTSRWMWINRKHNSNCGESDWSLRGISHWLVPITFLWITWVGCCFRWEADQRKYMKINIFNKNVHLIFWSWTVCYACIVCVFVPM